MCGDLLVLALPAFAEASVILRGIQVGHHLRFRNRHLQGMFPLLTNPDIEAEVGRVSTDARDVPPANSKGCPRRPSWVGTNRERRGLAARVSGAGELRLG